MQDAGNREQAKLSLSALLRPLCHESWSIDVLLHELTDQEAWPRPLQGSCPISLSVSHGAMSLLPLHQASKDNAWYQSALQSLMLACQNESSLPLLQVIELLWKHSRIALIASLRSQIIRCLGHKLDQALQTIASGGISVADIDVSLTGLHVESDYQLDQTLLRYQRTTVEVMKGSIFSVSLGG